MKRNLSSEEKLLFDLRNLYENFGYEKIDMDIFENYESYTIKNDAIDVASIFKIVHPSGKIYVLRPDMTVPIAKKFASSYEKRAISAKVYYHDSVFRMNNDMNQDLSEHKQVGIECIGNNSVITNVEIIEMAKKSLELISDNYIIDISDVKFLKNLFAEINLEKSVEKEIISLIEKKNLSDLEKYIANYDLALDVKKVILEIPNLYGSFEKVIEKAYKICLNDEMKNAIDELKELYEIITNNSKNNKLNLDFSMISNLDYYSGILIKGYIADIPEAVLSGGRYDKLTKNYGKSLPAIGFAVELDQLNALHNEDKYLNRGIIILYEKAKYDGLFQKVTELRKDNKIVRMEEFKTLDDNKLLKIKKRYNEVYLFENKALKKL